jgi:hypothetical protein
MSIIDSKKKVFGDIAALNTLTESLPKLKNSSSLSSINNDGNVVNFLSDLIKSLIGYDSFVGIVVNTITNSTPKIEREIKKSLKIELKSIVSCGIDPKLPNWFKSTGTGIIIEVNKIDFFDILKVDPNSIGGSLTYNDITTPLTNSSDFDTFLYGVIQDDGITYSWKNIIDITFNSLGDSTRPNNTLTIKTNSSYDNKTLTDVNNDFVDSISILYNENIINKIVDLIYGTISSLIGKSTSQLEKEAKINTIIDKMIDNINKNTIDDSYFSFSNSEVYNHELQALNRKNGVSKLNLSSEINSSIPHNYLVNFISDMNSATNVIQKKDYFKNNLTKMSDSTVSNVTSNTDKSTAKLSFIQQIINNLSKGIINLLLSPKLIFIFLLNYKIIYGQTSSFNDPIDFLKKEKKLIYNIVKIISIELIKILLVIALKKISALVSKAIIKREKEKSAHRQAQIQTLIGISNDIVKKITDSLI